MPPTNFLRKGVSGGLRRQARSEPAHGELLNGGTAYVSVSRAQFGVLHETYDFALQGSIGPSINDIYRYAKICRVSNVIRPYLEAL